MSHPAIEALLKNLNPIRERYGDEAYKRALKYAIREMLASESTEVKEILKQTFSDQVDFAAIEAEGKAPAGAGVGMRNLMAQQLRQQMPGLQTQAQFDAFMASFEALRAFMNHTCLGQKDLASLAKDALIRSLDAAAVATELSEKLGQVPEAATSPEADKYKEAPKEFGEYELQQTLLQELRACPKGEAESWYRTNRDRFKGVVDSKYRNELFDAVRAALV